MHFNRDKILKGIVYIFIGFFTLIIIISFGMPDFISRMGLDQNTIATLNGNPVHRLEYLRYRDLKFGHLEAQKMDDMLLNYFIQELQLYDEAHRNGVAVSEEKISELIRGIPIMMDPETGKFSPDRMNMFLHRFRMSLPEFYKFVERDYTIKEFMRLIGMGIPVTSDDLAVEQTARDAKIQFRYAYVSAMELQKRTAGNPVTEQEIDAAMLRDKNEVKDPKTDRARIKAKLEKGRYDVARDGIVKRINKLASENGSFSEAASILQGTVSSSNVFKIGEIPKDASDQQKILTDISNSKVFLDDFLSIKENATSRVIQSPMGLYVISPSLKDIKASQPSEKDMPALRTALVNDIEGALMRSYTTKIMEKSKVKKYLKAEQ